MRASLFLVCAALATEESEWSLKEAISQVAEVVYSRSKSEGVAFLFSAASGITFAMTASKFHAESSVLLSPTEKEYCSLEKPGSVDTSVTWRPYFPIPMRSSYDTSIDGEPDTMVLQPVGSRLIRYLSLALFVIILLSLSALFLPGQRHPWRRFDEVVGSNGPQYQLQLKPQNVSQWASNEDDVLDSKWFLRIDDGSIYPKELLTPEEAEYQAWLSERYPEVDAVKARGLYLDADYLSRPEENDMLIDKYFHISHCVHSMRRYWVAKETGKRLLCQKEYPRLNGIRSSYMPHDLSYWHMNHCFENILLP
ncbi:hypothetical protein AA0121_g12424 [Alternaria tenuissima]|jgi:hypothetical protein|nr:hypothetical protein AA0121_g12424 [Alternaria tenuissima]